jgi:hypothetical protein
LGGLAGIYSPILFLFVFPLAVSMVYLFYFSGKSFYAFA